ncbi:hypothetical protein Pmar_PMAR020826, partial [Perkinsus marinus ATCC 50983]
MDPGVRSISGHLNLPLLQELIQLTQYSDTQLAKDIQQGLPVIGKMPEIKGVFAPLKSNPDPKESNKKKTKKKKKLTASQLLDEASSSMRKTLNEIRLGEFDEEIWTATLAEVESGLMEGPYSHEEAFQRFGRHVISKRFPVRQPDKTRLCDDYRRSQVNAATEYTQRITLPTHHTLEVAWRKMSKARPGEPMTIYKSDHAAAYRQVPTDPNEAPFQLICVKGPDGEPAIFRHLALSFGASSSVVNYCRLSQCLIHLHRVMFGAVSMSFIDDYWGIEPATSAATAYECWTVLNELLGFKEKESKKAPPSSDVRLLGLDVQLSANTLTLSLTDEKRKQLCNSLSE